MVIPACSQTLQESLVRPEPQHAIGFGNGGRSLSRRLNRKRSITEIYLARARLKLVSALFRWRPPVTYPDL